MRSDDFSYSPRVQVLWSLHLESWRRPELPAWGRYFRPTQVLRLSAVHRHSLQEHFPGLQCQHAVGPHCQSHLGTMGRGWGSGPTENAHSLAWTVFLQVAVDFQADLCTGNVDQGRQSSRTDGGDLVT